MPVIATAPPRSQTPPLRAWFPTMLLLALVWGCSFLFIEVGIRELHPAYVTLFRVAVGAVTLLAIMAVIRHRLPRSPRLWAHMFVMGFIGATAPFTLFGYGEERVPSLLAGIWNGTTPLLVLPFAALVFRTERFTRRRVLGLVLGFAGVLVVLGAWRGVGGAQLTGQLLCLAASAFYGMAVPYQQRFLAGSPESGLGLSAGQLLMSTLQLTVLAPLLSGGPPPSPASLSPEVLGSVLALGALGTGIALALNLRNIRVIGGSTSSMVTYLIPIVAVLAGVLVLNESLEWHQPAGAVVVLLGVAVAQGRLSRPHRVTALPETPGAVAAPPLAADTSH